MIRILRTMLIADSRGDESDESLIIAMVTLLGMIIDDH